MKLNVSEEDVLVSGRDDSKQLWKIILYVSIAVIVAFVIIDIINAVLISNYSGTFPTITSIFWVEIVILAVPLGVFLILILVNYRKCNNLFDIIIGGVMASSIVSIIAWNIWVSVLMNIELAATSDPELITILYLAIVERFLIAGMSFAFLIGVINWTLRQSTTCEVIRFGDDLPVQKLTEKGLSLIHI